MKHSKWIGLVGVVILIIACMLPWVHIISKDIITTGLKTAGTNYGKPALMNLIMTGCAAVLFILPKIWAKRANLFFCAFNLAWAIRNYIVVSACYAGECPEKQWGLYLLILSSAIMVAAALFPDLALKEEEEIKN